MSQPVRRPVAATTALRELLTGPGVEAEVRGAFPTAVYLDTGDEVVAVVTSDAVQLPCSLILATSSERRPFDGIRPGFTAMVGDRAVVVGDAQFSVRRWWRPRKPRTLHPGPDLAARRDSLDALLPSLPHPLPPTANPEELVGLGPGLTPSGDDVLAALLLTLTASPVARTHLDDLVAATTALLPRTTSLSATLLRHAAAGRGIPEVIDVIDALGGRGDLATTAGRLLAVGHSSGAALAHGVVAATKVIDSAAADAATAMVA